MSSSRNLSVLITNYETWPLTLGCVAACLKDPRIRAEDILVVDDGSVEPPPSTPPRGLLVSPNPANLGYVRSVNRGMKQLESPFVLLLDSDARPISPFADRIVTAFESDPTLGILGFRLVDQAGQPTGSWSPNPGVLGFLLGQQFERFVQGRSGCGKVVFSCAMAVRRDTFEKLGGFDEAFDFLDADIDFSLRAQKEGWSIAIDESIVMFHDGSGSPQTQDRRVRRFHRNRLLLLSKNSGTLRVMLIRLLLGMRHAVEVCVLACLFVLPKTRSFAARKLPTRLRLLRLVWVGYEQKGRLKTDVC